MSDSIASELKSIQDKDKDLHQHLKQFVSHLLLDRSCLPNFEAYSAQDRISGGVQ